VNGAGKNMPQQTINIQNLYQMYQANPHSPGDRFAALDSISFGGQQQQTPPSAFNPNVNQQSSSSNGQFMPMMGQSQMGFNQGFPSAAPMQGQYGNQFGGYPQNQQQMNMGYGNNSINQQFSGNQPAFNQYP
jgi:hypothetical protein